MNLNKHNWFLLTLCTYIVLGGYVLFIAYSTPYIGMKLNEIDGQWKIDYISYDEMSFQEFAKKYNLSKGDTVLRINNSPIHNFSIIQYDSEIRGAKQLTIQGEDGKVRTMELHHSEFPRQFYMQFVFPSVYFLLTLFILFYLYIWKRNMPSLKILSHFLCTVSLSYISTGASSRADLVGVIINSSNLILCLILLLHFLKNYFSYLNVKWLLINNFKILYCIPFIVVILRIIRFEYPNFTLNDSIIILSLFAFLLISIFFVTIYGYIKFAALPQLKILFLGIITPFLPFFILFVIPSILFAKPIVHADICALFLLLIPLNIILLQLTDRLFDLAYHISRIRHYTVLSLFFTCWLIVGIYFLANLSLTRLFGMAIFLFISCFIFLYIKEKLDYRERKILFSSKGDYIHKLYQTIENVGKHHRVEQILQALTEEVAHHLEIKEVAIITYNFKTNQFKSTKEQFSLKEVSTYESLTLGEIVKKEQFYISLIYQDMNCRRWLIIDRQHSIRLKSEELLWLELLLTYTNTLIENTKIIEELAEELKQLQQTDVKAPKWLKKLVWLRVDEEKFQFAQELHDTFLQEHLHFARQIDLLKLENNQLEFKGKLSNLHKQMIHSIDSLRVYCETLKPPLLTNVGLHAALERLAERTEERANFELITTFDRLYLEDEQLSLIIYRIVQELLNNAIKHSQASTVELSLHELESGFEIVYHDDGIGCNLNTIWHNESLGLQGIRERVEAFDGDILIDSEPGKGMYIQINIMEGRDSLDFGIDYR